MSEETKKEQDIRENSCKEETERIEEDAQDEQNKKHKGDRKTVKKLEAQLEQVKEERNAFKDSYQRTFSEFNNFKKRNQTMASQAIHTGMCDTVEKMLPVLDNLERALDHADESDPLAKGVEMVYTQLIDILTGMGVKEIPADGVPFDPSVHQAIQQVEPADGDASGSVASVVQKGYMLGDKILRHSMVVVNK